MRRRKGQSKVKIGLLGCGLISQYAHLFALKKAANVELTAICDAAEDLVLDISQAYGVRRGYTDYERFLKDANIEAVLIATPDQFHVPQAIECLRHGKHVLIEKPLGLEIEECRRLAGVVEKSGLKLQVGNMKRFDPGIQFAHRFIKENMGQRLSVSGWYCDSAFRSTMQQTLRLPVIRSAKQLGIDSASKKDTRAYKLITHGTHVFNTLRYLGGEIIAVQARFATKYESLCWHGLLEYSDGAIGHFELTTTVKTDWLEGFLVHGEGGTVELQSFLPFYNRPSKVRAFDAKQGEYRGPIGPDSDPYERQLEAFARAILDGTSASPDVYDGIADLAVIRAIEKSVETGRRTAVALSHRATQ